MSRIGVVTQGET